MEYHHIKTVRNPEDENKAESDSRSFIRNKSFAVETAATLENLSSNQHSSLPLASEGGTFAQRARAAELQAARAQRDLSSSKPPVSSSLAHGRITLKMPKRTKWTPLDYHTPDASRSSQEFETHTSNGQSPEPVVSMNDVDQNIAQQHVQNIQRSPTLFKTKKSPVLSFQDLVEFPAEFGARLTDVAAKSGTPNHGSMQPNSDYHHPALPALPVMRPPNATNEDEEAIRQLEEAQATQIARLQSELFDEYDHQQLVKSTANMHRSGPTPGLFSTKKLPEQRQTLGFGFAQHADNISSTQNGPLRQYPAVRGTPAAQDSFPRSARPHLSAYNTELNLNQSRQTSEYQRELMRRSLYSIYDELNVNQSQFNGIGGINSIRFQPGGSQPTAFETASRGYELNDRSIPDYSAAGFVGERSPYRDWHPGAGKQHNKEAKQPAESSSEQKQSIRDQALMSWWNTDNRVSPIRMNQLLDDAWKGADHRSTTNRDSLEAEVDRLMEAKFGHQKKATTSNSNSNTGGASMGVSSQKKFKNRAEEIMSKDIVNDLLLPAVGNLLAYKDNTDPLNAFTAPPSWAIDRTEAGNQSFFSPKWGQPPQRVGRDPRYRALQHDGRSSIFDDPTGRLPREEITHGRGRWSGYPGSGMPCNGYAGI